MDIICKILYIDLCGLFLNIYLILFLCTFPFCFSFQFYFKKYIDASSTCSKNDCKRKGVFLTNDSVAISLITGVPIIVKVFPDPVWP